MLNFRIIDPSKPVPGSIKIFEPQAPVLVQESPSENEVPPPPAGTVGMYRNAQNGEFRYIFSGIRQNCPRIAVFLGKLSLCGTLLVPFGKRISFRIGLGYRKMKRRGVYRIISGTHFCCNFHLNHPKEQELKLRPACTRITEKNLTPSASGTHTPQEQPSPHPRPR